jgi:hypothetical protein
MRGLSECDYERELWVESYGCTSAGIIIGIEHAALERCTGEESGSPNLALSRLEPKIS